MLQPCKYVQNQQGFWGFAGASNVSDTALLLALPCPWFCSALGSALPLAVSCQTEESSSSALHFVLANRTSAWLDGQA